MTKPLHICQEPGFDPALHSCLGCQPPPTHVHDLGSGMTCACGFVLTIPPVWCSIEVGIKDKPIVNMGFNCDTVDGAIAGLKRALYILEREAKR